MNLSSFFDFKSVDEKIYRLGFTLTYVSRFCIQYERINNQFNYVQGVDIIRKTGKIPIIQSFQKSNDTMVGLTLVEAEIFCKKIKKLKWY